MASKRLHYEHLLHGLDGFFCAGASSSDIRIVALPTTNSLCLLWRAF